MNRGLRMCAALGLLSLASVAWGQSAAQKALGRLKQMAGTWVAKSGEGTTTFEVIAGGTAVMEVSAMGKDEMTTLFYVDGRRLLLTHFCPTGNQPRMQATISPDGHTLVFEFIDAANLANAEVGHMHRAVYTFRDDDHYAEDWTWRQAGKDGHMRMEYQRKK